MVDVTPKTNEVSIFTSHKAHESVADGITLHQS